MFMNNEEMAKETRVGAQLRCANAGTLFALAALFFAPQTVLAQNECGPGPDVTCAAGTYDDGITYDSALDFSLTTAGDGNVNASDEGIGITATGSAGIDFTPIDNVFGTGGATLATDSGDITAILTDLNMSGGLNVTSGSGDIVIERIANESTDMNVVGGGNITIFMSDDWGGISGQSRNSSITVDGSSGSGLIHILNRNGDDGQRSVLNEGLDATVGSGGLVLDIQGIGPEDGGISTLNPQLSGGSSISGGIVLRGTGAAEINLWRDGYFYIAPNFGNGGEIKLDNEFAYMRGPLDASQLDGGLNINVDGGGAWQIGLLQDPAPVTLSPANDVVRIGDGGFLHLPIAGTGDFDEAEEVQALDFGGGDDNRLVNEAGGHVLVGVTQTPGNRDVPGQITGSRDRDDYEAELRLDNLQTFVNDGEIWFGTSVLSDGTFAGLFPEDMIRFQGTDQVADDILIMPGTTFIGGPTGRIRIDVNLNSITSEQDRCDNSLRDAGGNFPVADCINLQNGSMEGTVLLAVTPTDQGGRGAFNPSGNVIIDMSDGSGGPSTGGGLADGAVVGFAPESRFYNPAFGGIIDNGMFAYHMFYDEDTTQVRIVGVPSAGAFHQTLIANAAQSAWRTANGSFFDRQADLRDSLRRDQVGDHGVWLRVAHDANEREVQQTFSIEAGDIVYDNTHDVDTDSVTLGVDFIRGSSDAGHWVVGGMAGYVRTDMEYARFWTDTARMNGMMAGFYGSYVNGPLFVDASASGNWTRLVQDMPQAELFRERDLSSDVETLGAQVEAGWRFDLGMVRLDPLVNASWSQTDMDDFKVPEDDPARPGNQVMFDKTTSQRIGLGLRGSREFSLSRDLILGVSLTGRVQEELDGEATAKIGNLNPISPEVKDEFDGTFSEVVGGLTLTNSTGRVSGVLNVGSKFGDDYDALSASASFRYQW